MNLSGKSLIGHQFDQGCGPSYHAVNPATLERLAPAFVSATPDAIDQACRLAAFAFETYRNTTPGERANFLRAIASNIEERIEALVERATAETGLPEARIRGEAGRTTGQLRLFAAVVEEGSWVDARIERGDPDRQPIPKPDLRSMLRPIGPVAVFGASNFPLAFSVAGGDTASALAAGCPVVVKAHFAHPGTSEIVGQAILTALSQCDLPEGTFSLLHDDGHRVGTELVQHPDIRAVGFTGSQSGGRALFDLAAARPDPIPVFAEMASINPVFLLPEALQERGETIADGLFASLTMGAGQFCTNPGLVIAPPCPAFEKQLTDLITRAPGQTMLHSGIHESYQASVENLSKSITRIAQTPDNGEGNNQALPALFRCDAETFRQTPELQCEIFGPSTLLVQPDESNTITDLARALEGQLTVTVHATDNDLENHRDLLAMLEEKAGRLIINQFPTGVDVCSAMVHGGPWPATTDSRSTSVGTAAILRFARPVSFQNFPDAVLPPALQDANPLNLRRMENGLHA